MTLDTLHDDYIEYPFLQENYNTRLKKFAYTLQWLPYQQDILFELWERGPLWKKLVNKVLTHTRTSQEEIMEVFQDIKIKRDKMIEKKYSTQLHNTMWEETISAEKNKFNTKQWFDLFVQFNNLQTSIQWKDKISHKEYADFIKKLTTIYYKKPIAQAKMSNTFKAFPIKKSDIIKIINTIAVHEDLGNLEKETIIENLRKNGPLDLIYKAMLEYPSHYNDLVDFVVEYYEQTKDFTPSYFEQALKNYTDSLAEEKSNKNSEE